MTKLIDQVRKHVEEVGDCWEWTGALQPCGSTPTINYNGRAGAVRRFLAIEAGMAVKGKVVTSKCGNPLCVCPEHVQVVTRRTLQQRIAKERRYQTNPVRLKKLSERARANSKLNLELVQQIREAEGKQRDIAKRFGISQPTVSVIKRGVTWRDYTNPFAQLIGGLNK